MKQVCTEHRYGCLKLEHKLTRPGQSFLTTYDLAPAFLSMYRTQLMSEPFIACAKGERALAGDSRSTLIACFGVPIDLHG
jgi:hypothetical protein